MYEKCLPLDEYLNNPFTVTLEATATAVTVKQGVYFFIHNTGTGAMHIGPTAAECNSPGVPIYPGQVRGPYHIEKSGSIFMRGTAGQTATIEYGNMPKTYGAEGGNITQNVEGTAKSTYATTALVASGVIKNAAGTLYGFQGINNSASAQYIHVFNSATVPADNAVPKIVITVPAASNFSLDLGMYGFSFATGISWSNSSTLATKTIGAADVWMTAIYK